MNQTLTADYYILLGYLALLSLAICAYLAVIFFGVREMWRMRREK